MAKRASNPIASIMGTAAVAGFGLSAGRDGWKWTRKSSFGILVAALAAGSFIGPFWGFRELVRGHDRGAAGTIMKTVLGSLLIAILGAIVGSAVVISIGALFGETTFALSVVFAVGFLAVGAAIGLIVGMIQRPGRARAFRILRLNREFLARAGIRETGGKDITHYDNEGNALRLLDYHTDRLVFTAVGKRGKRAYIALTPNGEMTAYSGVVTA